MKPEILQLNPILVPAINDQLTSLYTVHRLYEQADKDAYYRIVRWAAERGMSLTMHWGSDSSVDHLLSIFERVNQEIPIAPLRWSIAHLNDASVDSLRRMWEGERVTPEGYAPDQADADDGAKAELARRFATLTPQQMKILRLICQGKANKEISYDLSIAEATVKTHITAIMSKINARRRTQAVLWATRNGFLPDETRTVLER